MMREIILMHHPITTGPDGYALTVSFPPVCGLFPAAKQKKRRVALFLFGCGEVWLGFFRVLLFLNLDADFLSEVLEVLHALSYPGTGSLVAFVVEFFKITFQ